MLLLQVQPTSLARSPVVTVLRPPSINYCHTAIVPTECIVVTLRNYEYMPSVCKFKDMYHPELQGYDKVNSDDISGVQIPYPLMESHEWTVTTTSTWYE